MDLTMSETTARGPSSMGVAPEIRSNTAPFLLIAAARKLVPPRSTPIE
jgi:hypothetical protein